MANQKVLTPEQVKQRFKQRGITVKTWAEENGFRTNAVYRVLNGIDKAYYGKGHKIAVALGLKAEQSATAAA
ncbi:DNA-binding protein [Pseudomonas aestusnigri]|uniref:DNA-binding protein n=1 Tax=Halopseudomonas aestusnigri TaxID=857252 RepID=UPI001D1856F3|nr:DNA-binding protein [Halopseudomonas aestusnigri]MCC4259209.1 DNA-binding protein [Halopseudomonas aestusnigri]